MKKSLLTIIFSTACALLLQSSAFAQYNYYDESEQQKPDFHCNDLTPVGSTSGKLNGTSGGRQVGARQSSSGPRAVLINGNALGCVDLHNDASYYYSMAMCGDDSQQGGWGYSRGGGIHALVWSGSSNSCVDLNPSGYNFSYCLGVHKGKQVGYAQNQSYFVTASHAYCWRGSPGSGVDLHPPGTPYPYSRALGCYEGEEVGYVSSLAYPDGDSQGYHITSRAGRWRGSAASWVNLHPAFYAASEATCTCGTQQGGWGYLIRGSYRAQHAMLWEGTAASALPLHPAGYTDSKITSITQGQQVGEGWVGPAGIASSIRHALVWYGSAESVVDLNQYLPVGYTNAVATGIDANGNIVGYAYNGAHPTGLTIPANSIAVVFAPGNYTASLLAAITFSMTNVAPGDTLQVQVALGDAAPAEGTSITFLSTVPAVLATPANITIPGGSSNATFSVTLTGLALATPTVVKLYACDGSSSRSANIMVTPVVRLASVAANPVEGGFSTYGSVSLNIPAQSGGTTITLTSSDTTLVAVPATVTVPQGYSSAPFSLNTAPVFSTTIVPITATLNDTTVSCNVSLSAAPVISLTSLTGQEVIGGQTMQVTISLNNFARGAAVVSLTSGDSSLLQLPDTAMIPSGNYSVTISVPTGVVPDRTNITFTASYNGGSLNATVALNPIPTVTILQADYMLDTQMFKVQAETTFTNAILTYGGNPDETPFGTMQFEQGVFKGSMILPFAPTNATVWNSQGGLATVPVTIKTGLGGNSTGGGGGGGGSTTTTYKLTLTKNGKGTVTTNPTGTTFTPGTVVIVTATPDAGQPWIGWSGGITGTNQVLSLTVTNDVTAKANFR